MTKVTNITPVHIYTKSFNGSCQPRVRNAVFLGFVMSPQSQSCLLAFLSVFCVGHLTGLAGQELSTTLVAAHDLQIDPSTHECFHESVKEHRVCIFNDLTIYNGSIYYSYIGEVPDIPQVYQHFIFNDKPGIFLQLTAAPLSKVRALLQNQTVRVEENVVFNWRSWPNNYYHSVMEVLFSVYQISCTYLSLCTHEQLTSQLTAVFTDEQRPNIPMDWPGQFPAVYEASLCYAKDIIQMHLSAYKQQAVIARQAVAGIGPHDRAYGSPQRHMETFTTPPWSVVDGYRTTMARCFNLKYLPTGRAAPRHVTIINRGSHTGRHMQNADEMVARINQTPGFNASLVYLEGQPLKFQVEAFMHSDIVILTHGAAGGNLAFISPDAVVIEYLFRPGDHGLHELYHQLVQDLSLPASFIGVTPSSLDAVLPKLQEYQVLSAEEKVALIESKGCTPAFKGRCDYWKDFTFLGEWNVLEPALQLAADVMANGSHVYQMVGADSDWVPRRHPPGPSAQFVRNPKHAPPSRAVFL